MRSGVLGRRKGRRRPSRHPPRHPTAGTHTAGLSPTRPPGAAQAGGSAAPAAATGARRSGPRWSRSRTRPGPKTPPAAARRASGASAGVAPGGGWGTREEGRRGAAALLTWARPRASTPALASRPRPLPAAPPPGHGPPRPHGPSALGIAPCPLSLEPQPSVHEPPVPFPSSGHVSTVPSLRPHPHDDPLFYRPAQQTPNIPIFPTCLHPRVLQARLPTDPQPRIQSPSTLPHRLAPSIPSLHPSPGPQVLGRPPSSRPRPVLRHPGPALHKFPSSGPTLETPWLQGHPRIPRIGTPVITPTHPCSPSSELHRPILPDPYSRTPRLTLVI